MRSNEESGGGERQFVHYASDRGRRSCNFSEMDYTTAYPTGEPTGETTVEIDCTTERSGNGLASRRLGGTGDERSRPSVNTLRTTMVGTGDGAQKTGNSIGESTSFRELRRLVC